MYIWYLDLDILLPFFWFHSRSVVRGSFCLKVAKSLNLTSQWNIWGSDALLSDVNWGGRCYQAVNSAMNCIGAREMDHFSHPTKIRLNLTCINASKTLSMRDRYNHSVRFSLEGLGSIIPLSTKVRRKKHGSALMEGNSPLCAEPHYEKVKKGYTRCSF